MLISNKSLDDLKLPNETSIFTTYWPTVIAICLLIVLVFTIVLLVKKSPRFRTAGIWVSSIFATLTFIVAVALGVNTWVGYFPTWASLEKWVGSFTESSAPIAQPGDQSGAQSTGKRVTTDSTGYTYRVSIPATDRDFTPEASWVYLPPNYDKPGSTEKYPVIYALHGTPGTSADWFTAGNLQEILDTMITDGQMPPVIVVSPGISGDNAPAGNEPLNIPGGAQVEQYVTSDVVSWSDKELRTMDNSHGRAIMGMSAGGFASVVYGLHHPDVYGGVISFLTYAVPYTKPVANDSKALAENSPLELVKKMGKTSTPFYIGVGDTESTKGATEIEKALQAKNIPVKLQIFPGLTHTWQGTTKMAPYGLNWIAEQMKWGLDR